MENLIEQKVSSENVFKGKLLDVYSDSVILPNGNRSTREYIMHVGAACVVPIDSDENVIIEKQFRYPFHEVLTEIPAGKLNSKAEPHLEAALRELEEETGYSAKEMIYLGEFFPTCAYSDEIIHMYLAKGLIKGKQQLDEDEFVGVEKMPLKKLVEEIMQGNIRDGKTQAAVLKAYLHLHGEQA